MQPFLFLFLRKLFSSCEVGLITPEKQAYQQTCMQNLLAINDSALIRRYDLVEREKDTDACNWLGVTCNNGYVREVDWNELSPMVLRSTDDFLEGPSAFLIRWLPPSVREVDMTGLSILSRFLTNHLPRAIQTACLDFCGLFGSFDGEGLPRDLRDLFLRGNMLSGSVILVNLPSKLTTLDLYQNPIEYVYVANRDLPENLSMILFYNAGKRVHLTALDGKKVDKRVRVDKQVRVAKRMGFIE